MHHPRRHLTLARALLLITSFLPLAAATQSFDYLGDHPELILSGEQAWGELGLNCAAHQPGIPGATLQIGDKSYTKGVGHHASGTLTLLLDNLYSAFDAEVGLQPCGGGGTVIFRVFVDDQKAFDSGVMSATNQPKQLHLDLTGASEVRLESNDGGDGISCDMANWADARLTRNPAGASLAIQEPALLDIAPFGAVVFSNPARTNGAQAGRIEEYKREDVYLEWPAVPGADGIYTLPAPTNGLSTIGLKWLNRRSLKELTIHFAAQAEKPATQNVELQIWQGESAWQGAWRRIDGDLTPLDDGLRFRISPNAGLLRTSKVRWLLKTTSPSPRHALRVRKLSAYTRSRWDTAEVVVVQTRPPKSSGTAAIRISNGGLLKVNGKIAAQPLGPIAWNGSRPLHLLLRYSRPSALFSDPTTLLFRTRTQNFAVALDDLLTHSPIHVKDSGISISFRKDEQPTREERPPIANVSSPSVANPETILERVRKLPDQTLQQAWFKTHHQAQREGPVLLSLAGDNLKFVFERDGTLRVPASSRPDNWMASAVEIRPVRAKGKPLTVERKLEEQWLPMPVITSEDGGLTYRETAFVAPADSQGSYQPGNQRSVCVIEFVLTNASSAPARADLQLQWRLNGNALPDQANAPGPGLKIALGSGLTGWVLPERSGPLQFQFTGGQCSVTGDLPAGSAAKLILLVSNAELDVAPDREFWIGNSNALPVEASQWKARARTYWEQALSEATQIQTPDPFLNDVIRSSQVRCLIAARSEAEGRRIAPWIAAVSYGPLESEAHSVIRGMDYLGHHEFAQRALDYFISRYNTNGFLTTGYTTFGTAWHLWTLGEHYQLNPDKAWLLRNRAEIARVGDWIVRQLNKTQATESGERTPNPAQLPESGLMPPGVLADWNAYAFHFAMNAYYYAALRNVSFVLESSSSLAEGSLPYSRKATLFKREAEAVKQRILRAYRWTQAQSPVVQLRNGNWIPYYPSQVHSPGKLALFFPGQDAGRSWCYDVELGAHQLVPAGVLSARDPEVTRMLEHMEDVQFLADGWFDYPQAMNEKDWFDLGGFSKVQPYYTRNCEIYALRDEPKPFLRSYFNSLAAMLNPEVLTFWEHFNHSGAWDKTHETGYFLHQTRTMLLTERGQELWLAPLISSNWLSHGLTLNVSNAPTKFGPVSYSLQSRLATNAIFATITMNNADDPKPADLQANGSSLHTAPERIVLRLRHPAGSPIRTVLVNGKRHRLIDPSRELIFIPAKTLKSAVSLNVFY